MKSQFCIFIIAIVWSCHFLLCQDKKPDKKFCICEKSLNSRKDQIILSCAVQFFHSVKKPYHRISQTEKKKDNEKISRFLRIWKKIGKKGQEKVNCTNEFTPEWSGNKKLHLIGKTPYLFSQCWNCSSKSISSAYHLHTQCNTANVTANRVIMKIWNST